MKCLDDFFLENQSCIKRSIYIDDCDTYSPIVDGKCNKCINSYVNIEMENNC